MDRYWPFPVTSWLKDETLFSLCSRIHRVSGNIFANKTCQQLFQHPLAGSQHDFPARVDQFIEQSKGAYGDSNAVINRTLLPYFLPWKSEALSKRAVARVRDTNVGPLKFLLGISTSRFRAHLPLKACNGCMSDDRQHYGVAYWHLMHQYPGVWVCLDHREPLREANVKATGVGRFLWYLPDEELLNPVPILEPSTLEALLRFALLTHQSTTALRGGHIDAQRLAVVYAARLSTLTNTTNQNRLTRRALGTRYAMSVAPLRLIAELSALAANAEQGCSQLARIQRNLTSAHPIRHLSLIQWLYADWADFWQHYSSTETFQPCPSANHILSRPKPRSQPTSRPERQAFLTLLEQESTSISAAALLMGISTQTALTWATDAGITVKRRPKLIVSTVREKIIQGLAKGEDKQSIATELSLSIQSITRVLQTEIGLREVWREALMQRRTVEHREKWTIAVKQNPQASKKILRMIEPGTFAWLYRNDRDWLHEKQLAIPSIGSNNVALNWDARDTDLAHMVDQAVLQYALLHPGERVTLQRLYQALPELKRRLSQLGRLPLTQAAISAATTRSHTTENHNGSLFG